MILLAAAALAATLPAGRYGAELWVASATKTPIIGEVRGQSVSWLLVEVTDRDGQLWQEHITCAIELLDAAGQTRAALAPGFISAIPVRSYPVQITDGYRADFGLEHIGYDPAWPLPERGDAPGVLDWDSDGHPGATVLLEIPLLGVAEIYIAQRARMTLTGEILPSGEVRGALQLPLLEQRTLGASVGLLDRSPPIRPLPQASGFAWRPRRAVAAGPAVTPALARGGTARTESCVR